MRNIIVSLKLLMAFTVVTGIVYPVLITVVGQAVFPNKTRGGLIVRDGTVVGSELIGQKFSSEKYFWGRPSAIDYNPLPSGGSNLGPTSEKLVETMASQQQRFGTSSNVPQELVFASASGLDPHISPDAAAFQIERILKARSWDESKRETIKALIREHTAPQQLGFLGEKRVNILELNIALDRLG